MTSGNGNRKLRRAGARFSGIAVSILALVFSAALAVVAVRLNVAFTLPLGGVARLSARAHEAVGRLTTPVRITCFMAAGHPARQPLARLLAGLRLASLEGAGSEIETVFVSPQRDLAAARRLVAEGVATDTLVFDNANRRLTVDAADLFATSAVSNGAARAVFVGEPLCIAALERLGRTAGDVLYWLAGHDEAASDDYDAQSGYSDFARALGQRGFSLRQLRLWETRGVPPNAAALVVAAPPRSLAAEEGLWIQDYLNKGGRLLYLAPLRGRSGLEEVLARWGIVMTHFRAVGPDTLSGDDLVATDYGEHRITRGFGKTATVFVAPWCLEALALGDDGAVDRIRTTALVRTAAGGWGEADEHEQPPRFDAGCDLAGPVVLAIAAERGSGAAVDLGFRATRVVAVGDGYFAANGRLGRGLSANRDLALNMINWLTDIDAALAPSVGGETALACGLDREGWLRLTLWVSGALPLALLLCGFVVSRRRHTAF